MPVVDKRRCYNRRQLGEVTQWCGGQHMGPIANCFEHTKKAAHNAISLATRSAMGIR